jgi:hypothetical protein
LEVFLLVNAARVKQKIPSLLTDGATTKNKNYNSFFRNRYRFEQFKLSDPEKADALINRLVAVLDEIEQALEK